MRKTKKQNGESITYLRIKSGMSVSDLAAKVNISYQHMDNIEKERKEPSLEVLYRIAEALSVSVTSIVRDPQTLIKTANKMKAA